VLITHSVEQDVILATDLLARRGLRPIVVLIDAGSFNGPEGTDEIAKGLRFMRIPLRVVRRDDDLSSVLSIGE
jgi:hypothetical protein